MNDFLLIGSAASEHHGIFNARKRLDYDFIASEKASVEALERVRDEGKRLAQILPTKAGIAYKFRDGDIWDIELIGKSTKLPELALDVGMRDAVQGEKWKTASLDFIYTLKMSHRYVKNSPHFLKTMNDIHRLRALGAKIVDEDFFKQREKATYTYGHPKLNTTRKNFFKDDVPYIYDHDTIHLAVAIDGAPAYTKYMVEGEEVLTSREKFDSLPMHTRLAGVLEESYVLALERSIIPHKSDRRLAFEMAMSKVCTSITSGWFREFAWENYHAVLDMYNHDFVDKFEAALAAGKILPYKGKMA